LIHHSASETILVDLAVAGGSEGQRLALVQEVQHHPLSGKVLHVDFHEVAENEMVTVTVPVETVGEAAGVKTGGGVLEHVLFKIKVRALPRDLPEVINVDVSLLEIGQSIHLNEIPLPAGVEVIGDKNIPVISVAAPITEAQEAAALEAATTPLAEPEVLKEKKEEGEAAAAGATAKASAGATAKAPEKGGEKAAEKGADKAAEKKAEKKK
jgi:large subunit ribosomal protein L25